MALIPQRILNSYSRNVGTGAGKNDLYKDGDFVIYFKGCNQEGAPKCETEAEPYMKQWKTIFNAQR
jgi:mannan polymerase II complex MNN11 subunit